MKDLYAFGRGRYKVFIGNDQNGVLRRCVAPFDKVDSHSGQRNEPSATDAERGYGTEETVKHHANLGCTSLRR